MFVIVMDYPKRSWPYIGNISIRSKWCRMNSHRELLPERVQIVVQLYSTKKAVPPANLVGIVSVDNERTS